MRGSGLRPEIPTPGNVNDGDRRLGDRKSCQFCIAWLGMVNPGRFRAPTCRRSLAVAAVSCDSQR